MTLSDLSKRISQGQNPAIEVHSFEPSLYLLFLREGDQLRPIQDSRGETLKYFSRSKALKPLREIGLDSAEFVHQTAYAEMIGIPGDRSQTELRQTIVLGRHVHI